MKGIVFGYPGIGKSSIARLDKNYVDLESSVFKVDGERDPNWFKVYVNMALHIADQNRIVLMSTHPWTRDYLYDKYEEDIGLKNDIPAMIVYPDISLKEDWIYKCSSRYEEEPSPKNLTALKKVENDFEKDIIGLESDNRFMHLVLKNISYRLDNEIEDTLFKYSIRNITMEGKKA